MKTGTHPMKTKLFFDWGIRFENLLEMPDRGNRPVRYAGKVDLEAAILKVYPFIHTARPTSMPPTQDPGKKPMPLQVTINTEAE